MRMSHSYDSIEETVIRELSRDEKIAQLERKKRSLLHEMKILSVQMRDWITSNVVSQMGDIDKHPDAPKIPDSETRRVLTKDENLKMRVLKTFARFALAREIMSNSVLPELEELQNVKTENIGNASN